MLWGGKLWVRPPLPFFSCWRRLLLSSFSFILLPPPHTLISSLCFRPGSHPQGPFWSIPLAPSGRPGTFIQPHPSGVILHVFFLFTFPPSISSVHGINHHTCPFLSGLRSKRTTSYFLSPLLSPLLPPRVDLSWWCSELRFSRHSVMSFTPRRLRYYTPFLLVAPPPRSPVACCEDPFQIRNQPYPQPFACASLPFGPLRPARFPRFWLPGRPKTCALSLLLFYGAVAWPSGIYFFPFLSPFLC